MEHCDKEENIYRSTHNQTSFSPFDFVFTRRVFPPDFVFEFVLVPIKGERECAE